ncbi:CAP domain-containing protein [Devosia sp. YIM 151766]|uniref:CAP domain-containing protein n=1 Tax=Devosia sp. YIM 151766 TaxID=3017325 RepID=UPI00255CAAF6|nr:CAP domain-containing protein [Devosia sp. YIM 151766]WIY53375.1 CAP domain-containing protein [Devosia sp. YIM 151766]
MSHYSRRTFLFLGAASLLAACSSTMPSLPAKISDRPEDLTREQIVATINTVRRANGEGAWTYNAALEAAARSQARLMARQDRLSHDLGVTLRARVTESGYLLAVGENLAKGYNTLPETIDGWLNSQGHRNTLLSPKFVEFGLAFARTSSGKLYWALIAGGPFEAWQA